MKRWLVLVTLSCFLVLPGASATQATAPTAFMSYSEAKAAGLKVSLPPSVTGLRVCSKDDFGHGFSSAEEAEKSLAAYEAKWGEEGPDICQVDPASTLVSRLPSGSSAIGPLTTSLGEAGGSRQLPSDSGSATQSLAQSASSCIASAAHVRHVAAIHCSINIEGTKATVEVGNPTLCHQNCSIYKYVLGKAEAQTGGGHNIQSGWMESTAYIAGQYPVTIFDGDIILFPPVNLDEGTYYKFRVRHRGAGGSAGEVVTEWYDGSWHVIASYNGVWCENSDGGGNCRGGGAVTAYADNDRWFGFNAPKDGEGINVKDIELETAADVWKAFNPTNFTEGASAGQDPYSKCDFEQWHKFRAKKDAC